MLNIMKATGNTILLRLSIHWAISCGVIVVKLCNCARVALRWKGFGDDVLLTVIMLPIEHSWSLSSSILTEGILRVLGKLCNIKVQLLWRMNTELTYTLICFLIIYLYIYMHSKVILTWIILFTGVCIIKWWPRPWSF